MPLLQYLDYVEDKDILKEIFADIQKADLDSIAVWEKNALYGLELNSLTTPSHIGKEFKVLAEKLRLRCVAARKKISASMTASFNSADEIRKSVLYGEALLAKTYGFCEIGEITDANITAEDEYLKGIIYYCNNSGKAEMSARPKGISRLNPFYVLSKCENQNIQKHKPLLFAVSPSLIEKSMRKYPQINEHTKRRMLFWSCALRFSSANKWDSGITAGLFTGVKADADFVVSIIKKLSKNDIFSSDYIQAALLGYSDISQIIMRLRQNNGDLFNILVCALEDDKDGNFAFMYGKRLSESYNMELVKIGSFWLERAANVGNKAAQKLTSEVYRTLGEDEKSFYWLQEHAKHSTDSKKELFELLKNSREEKSLIKAEKVAEEIIFEYEEAAVWLGFRYFNQEKFKDAFRVFMIYYKKFRSFDSVRMLSHCFLNGYGTKENLKSARIFAKKAASIDKTNLSIAEVKRVDYSIALLYAYRIGGIKKIRMLPSLPNIEAQFVNLLIYIAKTNSRHFLLWKFFWKSHKKHEFVFKNINERKYVFRPFIELCMVDISRLNKQKELIRMLRESNNEFIKAILCHFEDIFQLPKIKWYQKITTIIIPKSREKYLSDFVSIAKTRVNSALEILRAAYKKNPKDFKDFYFIPWADKLQDILKALNMYEKEKLVEFRSVENLRKIAELGDANAAMLLFNLHLDKTEQEALKYLEIAAACNHSGAIEEKNYQAENGVQLKS